jgi:hypothetical protein
MVLDTRLVQAYGTWCDSVSIDVAATVISLSKPSVTLLLLLLLLLQSLLLHSVLLRAAQAAHTAVTLCAASCRCFCRAESNRANRKSASSSLANDNACSSLSIDDTLVLVVASISVAVLSVAASNAEPLLLLCVFNKH